MSVLGHIFDVIFSLFLIQTGAMLGWAQDKQEVIIKVGVKWMGGGIDK